jgi:hypothetical protein
MMLKRRQTVAKEGYAVVLAFRSQRSARSQTRQSAFRQGRVAIGWHFETGLTLSLISATLRKLALGLLR